MANQTYWAFISYSSKDAAFVKKLHAKLETYRMPRDLVGRPGLDDPIPKKLFPVFRDRDELPLASDLGSTIQDALKASRYLIVVCSPNSARSQWVNEEIRYYKSIGRTSRILALIIEGEPNATRMKDPPAPECFPEALRFHVDADGTITDQPTEPIAGDLRPGKDGWDLAFLKCIAGITGCGLNALTAREKKRARRKKLISAAVMLSLSAGAIAWWDFTRLKTRYYANTVDYFDIPAGYCLLSKDQAARREVSYQIESSRRKVRKITRIHSSGTPSDSRDFDSASRELQYREDGSIEEIVFRDKHARITARRIFSELKENTRIIEFKSEHNDSPLALSAADLSMASGASNLVRSEVTSQRATYNSDGTIATLFYLSSWREPRADPDGMFGKRYFYQGSPFPAKIVNLDADGKPLKNRQNFAVSTFQHNARGETTAVAVFDENEKPVVHPDGWHSYSYEYDANDHLVTKKFFDEANRPADTSLGFHCIQMTRSKEGDCVGKNYFDKEMRPASSTNGYHAVRETYDGRGNTLATSYYGKDMKPVNDEYSTHRIESTWGPDNSCTSIAHFDISGKPCFGGTNKVHRERYTALPNGLPQSISYFDTNDKPMIAPGAGHHKVTFSVDAMGRFNAWSYFDTHENPPQAEWDMSPPKSVMTNVAISSRLPALTKRTSRAPMIPAACTARAASSMNAASRSKPNTSTRVAIRPMI